MNTKRNKGSFQYIKRRKMRQGLLSLFMFMIAFGIFGLGMFLNKNDKANIFTVLSILFVLPSVKMLISFIVLVPFHSVSRKMYDEVIDVVPDGITVWTDVVFSSSERVMNLDFMIIGQSHVVCYSGNASKLEMMGDYLRDGIKKRELQYQVEVFGDFERFKKRIAKLTFNETKNDKNYEETKEFLKSLLV